MKEKALYFGKQFIEGAAVGGVSAVVLKQYDKQVAYLPKPIRYTVDAILMAGLLYTGCKATEMIDRLTAEK